MKTKFMYYPFFLASYLKIVDDLVMFFVHRLSHGFGTVTLKWYDMVHAIHYVHLVYSIGIIMLLKYLSNLCI